MDHFHLQSPAQQVAAEIQGRIERRQWIEKLPGIAKLCTELGVSRRTLEHALKILCEQKWIVSQGRRAAMTICRQRRKNTATGSVLIYETPAVQRPSNSREMFHTLERGLPQPVAHLHLPRGTKKAEQLRQIARIDAAYAVVLDMQGWLTDAVKARGIRTVGHTNASLPRTAPHFDISYRALVSAAYAQLFRMGHRRIAMPIFQRKPNVLTMLRETVRSELETRGIPYSDAFHAPEVAGDTMLDLRKTTHSLLKHTPPTALITGNFRQWLAVFSTLASLGLRVPQDVSLVCLSRSDDMDTVEPTPAHFTFAVNRVAQAMLSALKKPNAGVENVHFFPAVWVPGDSIAAPRQGK